MRSFILFAFIACVQLAVGQSPVGGGYRVFKFSTENGLPSNGIKGIQWDENTEFLWVATEAGISRFNGIDFVNFTRSNTPFISSERMRFMVRNIAGEIRAADMKGNVFSVSENRPELLYDAANKGEGWFSKLMGAAISDRIFEVDKIPSPNRIAFPFARVFPKSDFSAFFLNQTGTVVLFDLEKKRVERFGVESGFTEGFKINNAVFLFKKGDRRAYRLDESSGMTVPTDIYRPSVEAKVYWESGMAHPVIIDGRSAWILRQNGSSATPELICNEIPNLGLIKYVQYSEKRDLLFLGTVSRGFAVVRTNRVAQVRKSDASRQEISAYYSQWEWRPNTVFTNEGHLVGRSVSEKPPIKGRLGFSIYEDGDSLLWFSTGRRNKSGSVLHCLNRITGERKIFDRIDIYNLFALARWNGRVVIGNHKGVGVLSGDSIQTLFPINGPIPTDPMAYNLLPLEPNVFGLTSCAGWIRLDLKNKTSDTLLRLPGYCVRTQTKIGKYVFIGTYGKGIYLYHQGKIKNIPLDKNGFLSYTHCFAPDKDGFVWMSTNRGLFKASVADMIAAFNNRSNSIYYHYYGRNDGMEMTELNGGCSPCAATLSDGTISFPSMDGLLWVNPSTAKPLLPDGPIYLDEIRIDDDTIGEADFEKIPIARGHRTILLRLGFSAWCNPENIYLEYQLNDQAKWIGLSVEQGPTIRLNNLSPGEYTLRIRKSNGFGENNFSVKTLRFRVGSAWYEHPLIYLLYLSILIFLINLFSKYQNRRLLKRQKVLENLVGEKTRDLQEQNELLEKNNRIKTRLISIISHDIVTPLKFLTVAGRGLKEKRSQLSEEEQRETISDMTQTAQELQLLSTNILNWIKYQNENRRLLPESVSPHLLTEQVFGLLGSLAKEKSIRLVNSIDPSWNIEQFAEPLKILIYNLVSNSIRYSDKGGIEVGATANRSGESTIWVADEGIGMNEDVIQHLLNETELVYNVSNASRSGHGLGYLIIKDLVKWMGGRIEIQSKTGRGTTVSVFIRPRRKSNAV